MNFGRLPFTMGKVKTTWLLPGHSGRACNHEDIYTKQDRKTGKVYSVKVCNPNEDWTEKQEKSRSQFGVLSSALSAWIKENRTKESEDYKKVKATFDRQTRYGTLRGMMLAKGYATVDAQGKVTINVGGKASTSNGGSNGGSNIGGGDDERD